MPDIVTDLQVPNHIHTHKCTKMTLTGQCDFNDGVDFEGNPTINGAKMTDCVFRDVEQLKTVDVSSMEVTGLKIKFTPKFA